MDKTSDFTEKQAPKKRPPSKLANPGKHSKIFISKDQRKPTKKLKTIKIPTQKPEITPLKTRLSTYKENSLTKDSESFTQNSKSKISRQSTLKKKTSKLQNPKKRYVRGKSLGDPAKKPSIRPQRSSSKATLITNNSTSALKALDMNKKLTPRSTHPSPQHSHRTPDSIRISQNQNLPNLTEKKSKIPEVGYYCKRFSLFDKNKPLYKDQISNPIEKQEFPKLSFDNPFSYALDSSITVKPGSDSETVFTPVKEKLATDESFESPTRLIKVYSSPEGKMIKRTPESAKRGVEPKAPRKTIADFESPGSFVFSLSSNSSDDRFTWDCGSGYGEKKRGRGGSFKKDEESQTELIEFVVDMNLVQGLKLISKF